MADKDKLLELQIKLAEHETELRVTKELLAQAQNAIVHIAATLSERQPGNNETSLEMQKERAQMAEKENVELKGIVRYLQTEMAKSSQSTHTGGASKDAPRGSRNATHTPNSWTDDSTGSGFNIESDLLSFHDDDAAAATGRVADATRLNQQRESPKEQTPVSAATNGRNGDADRYERAPLNDSGLSDEVWQPIEPDPVLGMPSDRKKIFNSDGSISWMEVYPDPPVSRPVDFHGRKQKQAQRDPWYRVHHNEWRQLVNLGMYVQQWGDAQWQEWARRHGRYGAATWKLYWEEECKERFEQVSKQREAAGISGEGTEEVADRVHNDAHDVPGKETEIDKDRTVSQHPKDNDNGAFIPDGRLVDFGLPASQTQAVKVEGEFPTLNKHGAEESDPLEQKYTTAQRSVCKDSEVLIDIDAEHASKHEGLSAPLTMDTIEPLTKSPSPSESITQSTFHDAYNSIKSSAPTQGQDSVPTSGIKNLAEESPMTTAETFEEKKAPVGSKVSSSDYDEVAHELAATISTPEGSKEEEPEVGGMSDTIAMPFRIASMEATKKGNLVSNDSVMETPEVNIVEYAPPSGSIACKDTQDSILGKNAVTSTASIQPRQGQASAPTGMALGHALEHHSIPVSFSRAQALPNAHPDLPDDAKRAIFSQLSTEHPYRTAVITNIPPETTLTTVLEKVRGGKVMRSVLLPTNLIKSRPAMDGNVALIVFMDGPNAKAYVDECAEIQGIFFWSEQRNAHVKAKVALCHTPSNTCPGFLASPRAGFTRIVYLADNGAFSPKLVVGAVLKVYNRSQEERRSPGAPLRMGRNKDSNSLILEWAALRDAFNAKNALDKMQWLVGGFDVGFLPDPCGGPVETLEEVTLAKDPATVPSIDYQIMWLPPTSQTACLAEADKAMSAGNPNCVWRTAQDYGHQFAEGIVETVGLLDAELMTQPGPSRGANEFKGRRPFGARFQHIG
ncbi:hypothetical protein KC331_g7314 [Hortaea werneckii]|nr:hypothetical protein KC331_g7314 [Hortaea werneckii]KAI7713677.1 hypothetical protein KC353_g7376 [Hortaea werneckii]